MKKTHKWGILAPGKIAEKFAADLLLAENSVLQAAASRSIDKAEKFAKKYKAASFYGSYEELTKDPDVEIVYIASPHSFHFEHTMMCLEAGKHVLCEKPLALNYRQAKQMADKAKEKGLFLSEALWTRYIPATEKFLDILQSGKLGKPQLIKADFGFKAEYNPEHRLFNKKPGGGSLLDIGIYPVMLAQMVFGKPKEIKATARFAETGTDTTCSMLFRHAGGEDSILDSNLLVDTATEAWIYGEKAALKMHPRFHHSQKLSLYENHREIENFEINYRGNGYVHEIEETAACLSKGQTENPKLNLNFSLDLIETLDRVRDIIGLEYDI